MKDFVTTAFTYIETHQVLLGWLSVASVLTFIGTLVVIPWIIVRIPADYFSSPRHRPAGGHFPSRIVQILLIAAKNLLGCFFIAAGLIMLMIPGQGLLTIILGLLLMNFPGKYRLEQWLIHRKRILPLINRLRRRAGREPLSLRH